MGNWHEAIIDEEVTTAEQARELAATIVAWLAEEQIIEDRQCDCCLGEGACYPPGRRFMQACGGSENDASNGNYADFSQDAINGLRVVASRGAVLHMQGEFGPVACPACAAPVSVHDLYAAGGLWIEQASDTMTCSSCGRASILPKWPHPDIRFVALAFEFWNWSPLSEEFVAEVGKRLGHSVTTMTGKV